MAMASSEYFSTSSGGTTYHHMTSSSPSALQHHHSLHGMGYMGQSHHHTHQFYTHPHHTHQAYYPTTASQQMTSSPYSTLYQANPSAGGAVSFYPSASSVPVVEKSDLTITMYTPTTSNNLLEHHRSHLLHQHHHPMEEQDDDQQQQQQQQSSDPSGADDAMTGDVRGVQSGQSGDAVGVWRPY